MMSIIPWRVLEESGVGWNLPLSSKTDFAEVTEKQAEQDIIERRAQQVRSKHTLPRLL